MAKICFTKMQGLGNDFVIIDKSEYNKTNIPMDELAIKLCDRKFGIGADGLIIVNPNTKDTDIGWYFYNSDGSIAQMCGNGMRCFAKYVLDNNLVSKNKFSVETKAGVIIPEIIDENNVKVNMGTPILEPEKIPANVKNNLNFDIEAESDIFLANAVSMGNPHCIIFMDGNTKEAAIKYGPSLEVNPIFPEKTNVEFVKILSKNEITLDVWERGCGITLACGTGACAAAAAGILNKILDNKVKVNLPGGSLYIEWDGSRENPQKDIFMSGTASYVFTGEIEI